MSFKKDDDGVVSKRNISGVGLVVGLVVFFVVVVGAYFLFFYNDFSENDDSEIVNDDGVDVDILVPVKSSGDGCGDGVCGLDEDYSVCQEDCGVSCGDGLVDDDEGWVSCRRDLLVSCGDGVCDEWEHYRYCSEDCSECLVDDRGSYEPGSLIDGVPVCEPSPRWLI